MNFEPRRRAKADVSRLVGGYVDAAQPAPARIKVAVAGARAVDWSLARLGLAEPVALISGFWRSGTPWIQECLAESLGAKTVFEPLSPLVPGRREQLAGRLSGGEDALQAFMPAECPDDDPLWGFLERTFTGRRGSNFLLSCRRDVGEALRRRIVVKDVRLQFNLAAVHRRFAIPIIHVRRHPCAVVASLLAADWHWSFERVRLSEILSDAARDMPRDFDGDALSRIAAYWALTERHVARTVRGQPWALLVTYEDVVLDPFAAFAKLCRWVDRRQVRTAAFDRPSASVHPDMFVSPSRTHHDRWRRSLDRARIARVEQIVDHIHPAWRDAWA